MSPGCARTAWNSLYFSLPETLSLMDWQGSLRTRPPSLTAARDKSGKTALHYCAENLTVGCAELLLMVEPGLASVQDEEGYTTLHFAVISGNRTMVRFLVDRGADVSVLDNEKHSCVHWATVCGELECMDILVAAGADPSTPDIHGAYPIHYAAQMCGPNSEMGNDVRVGLAALRRLIQLGVDVSVRDQDGRPPLLWAASVGSSDAILALVNAGADVSATDKDGLTALHCAASRGHVDCLETLISLCGAEVDAVDSNGCSALFYAVTLGHADCTQLLLKYGAMANRQDHKGRTLENKMQDFHATASSLPDNAILLLTETWLDSSVHDVDRSYDLEHPDLEAIFLELHLPHGTVLLGCVYCPPSTRNSAYQLLDASLTRALVKPYRDILLIGDFNSHIDWWNNDEPVPGDAFDDLLLDATSSAELFQVCRSPTYLPRNSLLDLVFTTDLTKILSCDVYPGLSGSDHMAVEVSFATSLPRKGHFARTIWRFLEMDHAHLASLAHFAAWVMTTMGSDYLSNVDLWQDSVLLCRAFSPVRGNQCPELITWPAHCGAAKGQSETLKILAQHGANLYMRNLRGDLPLHEAVQSGRKDLVQWLLELQPSAVNSPNNNGRSALHVAAIANSVEMCKVLMDKGAEVNPVMRNNK
ncbi:hypothetical protein HPB47_001865, partial [Ixodes persulcatus]